MLFQVTDAHTAIAVGSGDVPVLATPQLIAWMEAATVQAAENFVRSGQTSVGTEVRVQHCRATPVGATIDVIAEMRSPSSGNQLTFAVKAFDSSQGVVATGEIDRAIVDRDRFLDKASRQVRDRSSTSVAASPKDS